MSGYTFAMAASPDPVAVGKYQASLAALKPCCTRCGATLGKREIEARRCTNREECQLRAIWANGPSVGGQPLKIAEVRALRKRADVRRTIETPAPIIATPVPVDTPAPVKSRVEALLDREDAGHTIAPAEWSNGRSGSGRGADSLIGAYARMWAA